MLSPTKNKCLLKNQGGGGFTKLCPGGSLICFLARGGGPSLKTLIILIQGGGAIAPPPCESL